MIFGLSAAWAADTASARERRQSRDMVFMGPLEQDLTARKRDCICVAGTSATDPLP
jgi:hypothetical protein